MVFFKLGTISIVEGRLTTLVWGMTWLKNGEWTLKGMCMFACVRYSDAPSYNFGHLKKGCIEVR